MKTNNNRLDFIPYKNKFELGEKVSLKDSDTISEMNHNLLKDSKNYDWYISTDKFIKAKNILFEIVNIHYFYGGIPIYTVITENNSAKNRIAEFYLLYSFTI